MIEEIVQHLDNEIERLQQARALLVNSEPPQPLLVAYNSTKRTISPAGRKKMAAAQKLRWAKKNGQIPN